MLNGRVGPEDAAAVCGADVSPDGVQVDAEPRHQRLHLGGDDV